MYELESRQRVEASLDEVFAFFVRPGTPAYPDRGRRPPHRLVDEQLAGPYAFWHHTHEFAADGDATIFAQRDTP